MEFVRTPEHHFDNIGWSFEPHYLEHPDGLRQHYVDESPSGSSRGTFLLLHGEPTWAYLYRDWIGPLVDQGFRVLAPDHFGFGRSDKPTDEQWYSIARHRAALDYFVNALDLNELHLVVQDWGGPIGLCTAVQSPQRYSRLFILNTWLHNNEFVYSDGIRFWRDLAANPDALGGDMPTGRIVASALQRDDVDEDIIHAAFDAPFTTFESKAGARRFPFCIPFAEPTLGDADVQSEARQLLRDWKIDKHLIFGDADPIFTWQWAQEWSKELAGSTLDAVTGAGHFVQIDAAADAVRAVLSHV
jgi:haloalkane dehalogenase